jgi:hypothetical protein
MTSWQTWAAALSTLASSPEAALSHRVVNFDLASEDKVGAAAIRCLQAATACLTAGLFAIEDPPEGVVELLAAADEVAEFAVVAAVVAELEAAGVAAELDEEELPPHPPIRAATASSAKSVLIMRDTLKARVLSFSVV